MRPVLYALSAVMLAGAAAACAGSPTSPSSFDSAASGAGLVRQAGEPTVLLDGPLTCPQHGVLSDIRDGRAHRMSGTARCVVPGHPQSEASPPFDFDPPPAGTSKVLEWHAWR